MKRIRVIGCPGGGKTSHLMNYVNKLTESGVQIASIGFVSFSRAAIEEARDRIGAPKTDIPAWKTLHATAFRQLDLAVGSIMVGNDLSSFCEKYRYSLSATAMFSKKPIEPQNHDDALLLAYGCGRARLVASSEGWERVAAEAGVPEHELSGFIKNLDDWKRENGKIDFHDLLERATTEKAVPRELEYLVLDEAQDLSLAQERYFNAIVSENPQLKEVTVAGDPAQSIFSFAGASPDILRREVDAEQALAWSHRLPEELCAYARTACGEAIEFHGRPKADSLVLGLSWEKALRALDGAGTSFVLARSNYLVGYVAAMLSAHKKDYQTVRQERHDSRRLLRPAMGHLIGAARSRRWMIDTETLFNVLEVLSAKGVGMPRGYKADIKLAADSGDKSMRDLTDEPWMKEWRVMSEGPRVTDAFLPEYKKLVPRYLALAQERGGESLLLPPAVTVMTIHQAKGKEADRVVLIPSIPTTVHRALNGFDEPVAQANRTSEARVWYVGCTRAREQLIVVNPYDPAFARQQAYPLPERANVPVVEEI